MKLKLSKIKEITTGAVSVTEEDGFFSLRRFTKEQEELYKVTNQDFYNKTPTTAGIKFLFKTNSKSLFLKIKVIISPSSSRKYFSVDVLADGKPVGYIDNFSDVELQRDYTVMQFPAGDFSKLFELGEGEKTVCVHLPWSAQTLIEEISVDDDSYVEGIKPQKKLLAYGDSITHGYDALRPSNRYAARLADMLDAEEFNKAMGGEIFFPELAKAKDDFVPDYITVAYGTNDWSTLEEEMFLANVNAFYKNLSQSYPDSKIFAITPIWRKDMTEYKIFGDFKKVEQGIKDAVAELDNVVMISGFDFVPKEEEFFADLRLHPNDKGFDCYAESLYKEMIKEIKKD